MAASVKVAEALITLGWFVGRVRLADAVEAANVPARAVLVAELAAPSNGFTVTVTVVPSGMFEAASPIVMGFVVPDGSMISGVEKEPVGEAGAATPATDVIVKLGAPGSASAPG
jgi:hypothetical protein